MTSEKPKQDTCPAFVLIAGTTYHTVHSLAWYTGRAHSTVHSWVRDGELRLARRLGNMLLFDLDAGNAMIAKARVRTEQYASKIHVDISDVVAYPVARLNSATSADNGEPCNVGAIRQDET